jgi:hypothetical protein
MTRDELREHIVDILRDVAEQGYEQKGGRLEVTGRSGRSNRRKIKWDVYSMIGKEGAAMTRDKLREHIIDILRNVAEQGYERKRGYDGVGSFADEILTLFASWKSPEDCKAEFMIGVEAWAREEWKKRGKVLFKATEP